MRSNNYCDFLFFFQLIFVIGIPYEDDDYRDGDFDDERTNDVRDNRQFDFPMRNPPMFDMNRQTYFDVGNRNPQIDYNNNRGHENYGQQQYPSQQQPSQQQQQPQTNPQQPQSIDSRQPYAPVPAPIPYGTRHKSTQITSENRH